MFHESKRNRLAVYLACAALAMSAESAFAQENVLLIIADDLGIENVGAYDDLDMAGITPPPTPNIDALATSGVRFTRAWSNPVCSPTRAAIHTGRHAFRTGVGTAYVGTGALNPLELSEVTLPEVLEPAGYATALVGKWHLGPDGDQPIGANSPNLAGWQRYAGGLLGALPDYYDWSKTQDGQTRATRKYATTDAVDEALAFIDSADQPWVVTVAFNAPHTPFHEPPRELHSQNLDGLNPFNDPVPFYKAMIEAMDSEIGRLLSEIDSDDFERTWVIFIGDNGTPPAAVEGNLDINRIKGTVYERGVNVPLLVAGPGVEEPGRSSSALVHAVDLFSTIADIAGAAPSSTNETRIDGVSFLPVLTVAGSNGARTTNFTEVFPGVDPLMGQAAIRNNRFKLVRTFGRDSLFDLFFDPTESVDLLKTGLPLTPVQASALYYLRSELDSLYAS